MGNEFEINHFAKGMRIELHPATDRWMMGDRYGEVVKIGRTHLTVKMDVSGRSIRVHPSRVGKIV